jgi:hypothetical protein
MRSLHPGYKCQIMIALSSDTFIQLNVLPSLRFNWSGWTYLHRGLATEASVMRLCGQSCFSASLGAQRLRWK